MKSKLKISYNAPVTLTFMLASLFILVIGAATGGRSTELLFSVYRSSLLDPLAYLRLVGHVLGHTGFEHFAGNAMCLLLLGPMLEEKYGSKKMLIVFTATALVSGAAHCFFQGGSSLCGASGVVFACIVLSSFTAFEEGEIPLSFILVVVVFIGAEVCDGVFARDSISNLTHILGGAVGGVAGFFLNKEERLPRKDFE